LRSQEAEGLADVHMEQAPKAVASKAKAAPGAAMEE
jgi:hypothetical protein